MSEKRSLDLLRDQFAFRIVIFGENTQSLVSICYQIANEIIRFSLEKGLTLCELETSNTGNFSLEKHPEILIPKKSGIAKDFKSFVKDTFLIQREMAISRFTCFLKQQPVNILRYRLERLQCTSMLKAETQTMINIKWKNTVHLHLNSNQRKFIFQVMEYHQMARFTILLVCRKAYKSLNGRKLINQIKSAKKNSLAKRIIS